MSLFSSLLHSNETDFSRKVASLLLCIIIKYSGVSKCSHNLQQKHLIKLHLAPFYLKLHITLKSLFAAIFSHQRFSAMHLNQFHCTSCSSKAFSWFNSWSAVIHPSDLIPQGFPPLCGWEWPLFSLKSKQSDVAVHFLPKVVESLKCANPI